MKTTRALPGTKDCDMSVRLSAALTQVNNRQSPVVEAKIPIHCELRHQPSPGRRPYPSIVHTDRHRPGVLLMRSNTPHISKPITI